MSFWGRSDYFFGEPRKTVGQRRADAARKLANAARAGKPMAPVAIVGRKIASTFWGKAWCDNLERYRDYAHRLERGRSYVRSGSVLDLKIEAGRIAAIVSGSSLYEIAVTIDEVEPAAWRAIQRDCTGGIGSRLDLLAGKLSAPVMERLCADRTGLFPAPSAIRFTCSCPDYAIMCKHVAAVMYGVGARLDTAPELLFALRGVAVDTLLAAAVADLPAAPKSRRILASDQLGALFGIELASAAAPTRPKAAPKSKSRSKPKSTPEPKPEPKAKPKPPTRNKTAPAKRKRTRAPR